MLSEIAMSIAAPMAKYALRRVLREQTIRGFNAQTARQSLFWEIIANIRPYAIIETGTCFGTTTEFMSRTGLPVYSIEASPRYYRIARARLWRKRNIQLLCGDSRTALRKLFDGPLHPLCSRALFFYLDAHWNVDLPLAEEIDIVFRQCPSAVVMIDDFRVPSDAGYGYDDYGPGKALVSDYIQPAVLAHHLGAFYPSSPSAVESGARRGCIVLAKEAWLGPVLASMPLLRLAAEA
jgi:hypothetical protein